MKRNRMLFLLGLGAVLVLVCVWLGMPYENEVHDNLSPKTIPAKSKPSVIASRGGGAGIPAPPDANKKPEFPPFEQDEDFYRINPAIVDKADGLGAC